MAFLAHRGYGNPVLLASAMTEDQLALYVSIELEAQAEERSVSAMGVLAAIANAFGAKNAMKKFTRALSPKTTSNEGSAMRELRQRIAALPVERKAE